AAERDQSDFGLGTAERDRTRLAALHASLRAADWKPWRSITSRGQLAVADYKGRLLFSTGHPEAFGLDLRRIQAIAAVYRSSGTDSMVQVMRREDPALAESGLATPGPSSGLVVLFARAALLAQVPLATFIQTIEGRALLSEITLESGSSLALVAP